MTRKYFLRKYFLRKFGLRNYILKNLTDPVNFLNVASLIFRMNQSWTAPNLFPSPWTPPPWSTPTWNSPEWPHHVPQKQLRHLPVLALQGLPLTLFFLSFVFTFRFPITFPSFELTFIQATTMCLRTIPYTGSEHKI